MVSKESLEALIQDLLQASEASAEAMGLTYEGTLHPPADPAETARFEERHGRSFPPSYRRFLSLHNGWEGFRDVFTLIGVSGQHTEKALEGIRQTVRIFDQKWNSLFAADAEQKVLEFEGSPTLEGATELGAHIYLPHMFHFGTDFAGSLFYFHPAFVDPSGEMPVIYRSQKGEIVKTYTDFVSFLEANLALLREEAD